MNIDDVKEESQSYPVILGGPGCSRCANLKNRLTRVGAAYAYYDLPGQDELISEIRKHTGGVIMLPVVVDKGDILLIPRDTKRIEKLGV